MTVLKTSLRSFFSHKARMLLSGVAVMISVAFVCGSLVFSDTLSATFDKFFTSISSDVTVEPEERDNANDTGRPETLPASLVERLAGVDGVAEANGMVINEAVSIVDGHGESVDSPAGAPTFGGDWGPVAEDTMNLAEGDAPSGPNEALIDADTAESNDIAVGDELRLITMSGTTPVRVTGLAEFEGTNPGAAYLLMEPAAARETLLGGSDLVSAVHVNAADGVSDAELKRRIAAELGPDSELQVHTREESTESMTNEVGSFLDITRYAMLGFAGVAVLVGIFLIVNTFSMLVAQRTREIGLMRAVGASRRQTGRTVLVEALLLGVIGSVLGVGAGIGLAVGLMSLMQSSGINLSTEQLTVNPATPIVGLVVGVVSTLLAAWLPARRAGRVSPMAALREAGAGGAAPGDGRPGRLRAVLGLLLVGGGAAALWAAGTAGEASDGAPYLMGGLLLTLVGAIVVGPLLASVVVRVLNAVVLRVFGSVGRMAGRNALRNPRRTGATAGALMIGLALVGSLSVVASSVVASASDQLDRSVGADFIIESSGSGLITPQAVAAIRDTPGLAHVTEYRGVNLKLTTPDGRSSNEEIVAADPTYAEDLRAVTVAGELADAYQPGHLAVSEGYAEEHDLSVGDELTARFVGGDRATLTLGAITSEDTLFDQGAMYMSTETARAHLPADQMPLNFVVFAKADPGQKAAVHAALKDSLRDYPQYDVRDQEDYKQLMEDEIGGVLNLVYGLLALAIIVAILGVVNTLALSVIERTREIGLMRAIGLSRRQLRRMVRLESVVIALFGALLGLGMGLAWGWTAQQLLAESGFGVLEIPWPTIGTVFAGSAVVGLIAALVPAFRAGRMNVLGAIATE
ncbi:FtsX-like permease family protein [Streptomyces sp. B6B3]|uniref:ABC transporter permease n=1 Tax=Streptomyces sp. B6B3 TaxID=3153570 RepID=UPI00325E4F2B